MFRTVSLLAFIFSLSMPVLASAGDDTAASKRLSQLFATMESIRADFDQQISDESGAKLQQASGTLVVKRPRQFYWRTQQPYEHLIVASGDVLWIYDVDLEQVSKQPFTDDLDRAPALILSGEADKLAQQYRIAMSESLTDQIKNLVFTLTPLASDGVFRELQLIFTDEKLVSMKLVDNFQQQTLIRFSGVTYNIDVAPDQFEFTPPAGIDVIVNEP